MAADWDPELLQHELCEELAVNLAHLPPHARAPIVPFVTRQQPANSAHWPLSQPDVTPGAPYKASLHPTTSSLRAASASVMSLGERDLHSCMVMQRQVLMRGLRTKVGGWVGGWPPHAAATRC